MTKDNIKIALHFLLLIPFQVLIANHLRFFGYINPQIAILFILWYPLKKDITGLILNAFFFGLLIDIFCNSGGINTAACLAIAYFKLPLLKFIFKDKELDLKTFKYSNYNTAAKIIFVFVLAFIHQVILYVLEYFNTAFLGEAIYKSFTNSLFTTFVVTILLAIFTPTNKK
ncbi:hypothetical protein ACXGQW_04700 [Wenyingzhuangia sp. IMCC45533]